MRVAVHALLFIALVAALMVGGWYSARPRSAPPTIDTGGVALPALFVIKDGARIALAGPRPRPMLLHLWASWCGPCVAELPSLLAFGAKGPAEVVAVSVDDDFASVVKYFDGKIPREVVWDQAITLENALGVRSIPATFLVDTRGYVIDRWDGAHDWSDPRVRADVVKDLAR